MLHALSSRLGIFLLTVALVFSLPAPALAAPAPAPKTPVITSVSPNPVTGSPSEQTLTLKGRDFRTNMVVKLRDKKNGQEYTKTPVSITASQAQIKLLVQDTADWEVWLYDGKYTLASNVVLFKVQARTPGISGFSPSSFTAGTSEQTVTLNVTDFRAHMVAKFRHKKTGTEYTGSPVSINASQVRVKFVATVPGDWDAWLHDGKNLVASNIVTFPVKGGDGGGGTGGLEITGRSPDLVWGTRDAWTITLKGTGFRQGLQVKLFNPRTQKESIVTPKSVTGESELKFRFQPGLDAADWKVTLIDPGNPGAESKPHTLSVEGCANPSKAEVNRLLEKYAKVHDVPLILLRAMTWKESEWEQCRRGEDPNGTTMGIGLLQKTIPISTPGNDSGYKNLRTAEGNIDESAKRLKQAWEESQSSRKGLPTAVKPEQQKAVLENWWFALRRYNGWASGNDYAGAIRQIAVGTYKDPPTSEVRKYMPLVNWTDPTVAMKAFTRVDQAFVASPTGEYKLWHFQNNTWNPIGTYKADVNVWKQ